MAAQEPGNEAMLCPAGHMMRIIRGELTEEGAPIVRNLTTFEDALDTALFSIYCI